MSNVVDFTNSQHYDYICKYLNNFMNDALFLLISYIFGKQYIIKKGEKIIL